MAAVPLMVWRLSAPLATVPRHAARREAAGHCGDPRHLRHFIMDGKNYVGADPAVGYPRVPANFHVADACS